MPITEFLERNARLYPNDVALVEVNPANQPDRHVRQHPFRDPPDVALDESRVPVVVSIRRADSRIKLVCDRHAEACLFKAKIHPARARKQ